jgi:hypothetical protein
MIQQSAAEDLENELDFAAAMLEDLDIEAEFEYALILPHTLSCSITWNSHLTHSLFLSLSLSLFLPPFLSLFLPPSLSSTRGHRPQLTQQDVVYLTADDVEDMAEMQVMEITTEPAPQRILIGASQNPFGQFFIHGNFL